MQLTRQEDRKTFDESRQIVRHQSSFNEAHKFDIFLKTVSRFFISNISLIKSRAWHIDGATNKKKNIWFL